MLCAPYHAQTSIPCLRCPAPQRSGAPLHAHHAASRALTGGCKCATALFGLPWRCRRVSPPPPRWPLSISCGVLESLRQGLDAANPFPPATQAAQSTRSAAWAAVGSAGRSRRVPGRPWCSAKAASHAPSLIHSKGGLLRGRVLHMWWLVCCEFQALRLGQGMCLLVSVPLDTTLHSKTAERLRRGCEYRSKIRLSMLL